MKPFKVLAPPFLASLITLLKNFTTGSPDPYYNAHDVDGPLNDLLNGSFFENQSEGPQEALPINENGHGSVGDIYYEGEAYYKDNVTSQAGTYYYMPFYESMGSSYPSQINVSFDPHSMGGQILPNYVPPNSQGVMGPFYPGQPNCNQYQLLESNAPHRNQSPNLLLTLTKISDLDLESRKKIKELGFTTPKIPLLVCRLTPTDISDFEPFFEGIVYFPFTKTSAKLLWGRTGKPELFIRVGKSIITLFEMRPGFDPPKSFRSQNVLKLSKARETFRDAIWSIQIGAPNKLIKIGDDPSKIMTLWTITGGKADVIDLKSQEMLRQLPLQKGTLIVAIPTQLNHMMQKVNKGTTYKSFLAFVKRSIDLELDQLILIIKVGREITVQRVPDKILYESMNAFHSDQANVVAPTYDNLYQPLRSGSNNVDHNLMNAPVSLGHNQSLMNLFEPNQPYFYYQYQPLGDSIPQHHLHQNPIDINPSTPPIALDFPNATCSVLNKISELDCVLREKIKGLGFHAHSMSRLLRKSISKAEGLGFSKGIVYAPFTKGTLTSTWGRTGKPELYISLRKPAIFLFEMKPGHNPPKSFRSESILPLLQLRAKFKNVNWSILIGPSNGLAKIGADPSKIVTLWTITGGTVEQLDLTDPSISKELSLQKGDLIVVMPAQLSHIIQMVKEERTYDAFLKFIKLHIDCDLDQLISVVEI